MGKLLGKLYAFNLAYKNFSSLGNLYACKRSDFLCALSYYFSIERAVYDNGFSYLIQFVALKQIAAAYGKFLFYLVINFIGNDN